MRVLLVAPELQDGGAERAWAVLAVSLVKRGHRVLGLTLAGEGGIFSELRARGVDVVCVGMHRRSDVHGWRRAIRIAHSFRPHLVVSRSVSAQVVGQLMAWRLNVPHVTVEQGGPRLPLKAHQRVLRRLVGRHVDRVIAVSSSQLSALAASGFGLDRARVIPNGVDDNRVRPRRPRAQVRQDLSLRDDDVAAMLIANLRPEKRIEDFIRGVAAARRRDTRIRGFVAGDGSEHALLAAAAARTDGAVQLLGFRSDAPDLLNAADVVCLTSETEGIPLVLVEAMALGRPVLATRVGGVVDLVVDRETGVLLPPCNPHALADALVDLANAPERAVTYGEAGRRRQRAFFTGDAMTERYLSVFEEVVHSP